MSDAMVIGWQAASERTRKSIAGLRRLVADGQLPASRDDEARYVFAASDLDALRAHTRSATSETPDRPGNGTALAPGAASGLTPPSRGRNALVDDLEAAVYRDLARGVNLADIALQLGVDPDWLRRKAAAWYRLNSCDLRANRRTDDLISDVESLQQRVDDLEDEVASLRSASEMVLVLLEATRPSRRM